MGLPVTVYRSTDVGAPQLDGTILSLLVVIQKVLVDGYGQKLGLGWTRLFFDDTAGAVIYRNNISEGGSGGVVRFNATNGISTLNTSINIQVAKDASSLNALFHKSPSIYRYVQSSALVWEIIGTGRGFYMSISPSTIPRLGYSTVLQWTTIFR